MRFAPACLLFLACGGGQAAAPPAKPPVRDSLAQPAMRDTTYPSAGRGEMVAHADTRAELAARWTPTALRCRQPASLQLLGRGDTVDILVTLGLPADSQVPGDYTVAGPADTLDAPRRARVGVQRIQFADLAWRGVSGTVRLERLDRRVSGHFDVTLRELDTPDSVRYLGDFNAIPIEWASEAACRPARRDSTVTAR